KALGELLIDIHGQHAHQSLLRAATQRDLLDEYGAHSRLRAAVADSAQTLRATERAIADIEQMDTSGDLRIDLLRYQVDELAALALTEDEYDSIEQEHRRLASAERLISDGERVRALLSEAENGAAVDQLGVAERLLAELQDIDAGFDASAEMVAEARIQAQEASETLRQHIDTLDIDPERFAELETRLGTIQDLARKQHTQPAALPALSDQLAAELADLEQAGERLQRLKQEHGSQLKAYREAGSKLSAARSTAGARLAAAVTSILQTLGMPEGRFEISVNHDADAPPSTTGTDRIDYLISANPGQTARPLERVASGGELSRISLAIEVE